MSTYDAFIVCAQSDAAWVDRQLAPRLKEAGLTTLTSHGLTPGRPRLDELERGVVESRRTLLILTPDFLRDQFSDFSGLLGQHFGAINRDWPVIPLILRPCALPPRLEILVCVDLSAGDADEWQRLLTALDSAAHSAPPAPAQPAIFWGVGQLPTYHVTRSHELDRLRQALTYGGDVALTALEGMGGIGKSTLARALAFDPLCAERYPGGVLWGELGPTVADEVGAESVLLGWGVALGVLDTLSRLPGAANKAAFLAQHLADRRALLIVDDAWHAAPARLLLKARGRGCDVLLTTRFRMLAAELELSTLHLDKLTPQEALDLLAACRKRALEPAEMATANELVQRLGFHPLAVRVAGSQLGLGRTWNGFLDPLRRGQGQIIDLLALGSRTAKEASLQLCFDLSVAGLDDDERARYCWLGVLAPDAPFEVADAEALWSALPGEEREPDEPLEIAHEWLLRLVDAGLLESTGAEGAFRQHLLLRQDALKRLTANGDLDRALERHAAIYVAVARAASASNNEDYRPIERDYAQIEAVLRRAWRALQLADDRIDGELRFPADGAYTHLNDLVYACDSAFWSLSGRSLERIQWLQRAVNVSHRQNKQTDQGNHLGNLGNAYAALGQVERAISHYQQALAISREIGDRRAEGSSLGNLGLAYAALGQVERAISHYQQALAISREIGDRRGEGAHLGNLGLAYADLGQVERAISHSEQALAISREIGDRRGEGSDLGNLGLAYAALGQVERAISHSEQALAISREIGDRRGEGSDLGNLGNAYRNLGQVERAISHSEQALAISREIGDRRAEGNALGALGNAYAALGQVERAISHYEQALAISREIGDRRGEGSDLGNLGNAYRNLGQVERAISHFEQALAISREIGDRRGESIHSWNLGLQFEGQGRVADAVILMQMTVEYESEIGHPDAESDAMRLAQVREKLKQ
jgi:tetratricopeptide (TPR) repeat protein